MTPKEFVLGLLRHAGKRFKSPEDETAWHKEMAEMIGKPSPKVLRRAYEILRGEMDDHVFPAPGVILKAIARAAGERGTGSGTVKEVVFASKRRAPSADEIYEHEQAQAWQSRTLDQYGDWAKYHRATGHLKAVRGKPSFLKLQAPRMFGERDE